MRLSNITEHKSQKSTQCLQYRLPDIRVKLLETYWFDLDIRDILLVPFDLQIVLQVKRRLHGVYNFKLNRFHTGVQMVWEWSLIST